MADVTYIPDGNQANNILPWMLAGNNGFGNGLGGWGGGILGFILGILLGNGGFFGNGFGGGNGVSAQIGRDNNTELVMNAINGTDADIRLLATTLNADVNQVTEAIHSVQNAI
jgi:hypothetical protein